MNITVYLGAHEGNDPIYRKPLRNLAYGLRTMATDWCMADPTKD